MKKRPDVTREELHEARVLILDIEKCRNAYVENPSDETRLALTRAHLAVELRQELWFEQLVEMASRCVTEETLHRLMGPMWKSGHPLGTDTVTDRESREVMALVVRDLADAANDALLAERRKLGGF